MRENVKRKMAKYLERLIDLPSADKCHWCFALMLKTLYVNELTYAIKLHEIETLYTRTIIYVMMPKFYDYIVAAELAGKPDKAPPAVNTANNSHYFNEETIVEPRTTSRGENILRERFVSQLKVFFNAAAA